MSKSIKLILLGILVLTSNKSFAQIDTTKNSEGGISQKSLHNISVFNKVYGYVRHFSPSLAVDTFYGWEDLLIKYLPLVESANSDSELCNIINECFLPLDSNIIIRHNKSQIQKKLEKSNDCDDSFVYRSNRGWGNRGENKVRMKFLYTSNIEKTSTYSNLQTIYQNFTISMPLVTCVNDKMLKHYNKLKEFNPISKIGKYDAKDKYVRIGIIMEVWNVNEYFYPYMKVMKINNESIFAKYIKIVSRELEESEFFKTLERFAAEYKDGHAAFMPYTSMKVWPDYVPPLKLQKIGDKMVVTYVADSIKSKIKVGDLVLKIDKLDANHFFKNKQSRVSSATQTWNKYMSEKELLCGVKNSTLELEVLKEDKVETVYLSRDIKVYVNERNANKRPNYYEIKKGYYYINLFNLNDSILEYTFNNILPNAKGLVFDVRGYPRSNKIKELLGHLSDDTLFSSKWSIPVLRNPSQPKVDSIHDSTLRWALPPFLPRYTSNIVFIIDGRVISSGESIMSIVEHYQLGKIVGEQTAGTNGNINSFQVFGLYQFWHTEMYIPRYDGSVFHGVGIIPQVKLKPNSIKNFVEERDVFIQEAIKMLN